MVALATIVLGALSGVYLTPANADTTGSSTGSVSLSVRSVTVSPTVFIFNGCVDSSQNPANGLVVPMGECISPSLTVTNGGTPGHINVHATNFAGSAGGTWTISDAFPTGTDQANLELRAAIGTYPVSTTDRCDKAWSLAQNPQDPCVAQAGQSVTEAPLVRAPSSSTSSSPSYSTTITWSALP
jgi:hypothetical protein